MGKNPAQKAKDAANKKAAEGAAKAPATEKKTKKAKPKKAIKAAADKGTKSCRITSCKRKYRAKGYCKTHYRKWRHGEYGDIRYHRCHDTGGCFKPMAKNRHGFCEEHYQAYYIKGVVAAKPVAPAKPEEKPAAAAVS
jgi:hypothetical protein